MADLSIHPSNHLTLDSYKDPDDTKAPLLVHKKELPIKTATLLTERDIAPPRRIDLPRTLLLKGEAYPLL